MLRYKDGLFPEAIRDIPGQIHGEFNFGLGRFDIADVKNPKPGLRHTDKPWSFQKRSAPGDIEESQR